MRFTFADNKESRSSTDNKFSPAQAYIYPPQTLRYWRIAALCALLLLSYFLLDLNFSNGSSMMPGPLASSHANFGNDCAKCHTPFGQVADTKCFACHEKATAKTSLLQKSTTPIYSFKAHYVYRSDSIARAQRLRTKHEEQPCRACHMEHRGSDTKLSQVANRMCASCHFESFSDDHPNFQFARTAAADDSALKFTHIKHVREVQRANQEKAPKSQFSKLDAACLHCHELEPDGKLFQPIAFERHCSSCHLQNTLTPALTLATKEEPGVLTLEDVRKRNDISTQWARAANPNEFRMLGETRLQKRVTHRDPWVMWHLGQGAKKENEPTSQVTSNQQPATSNSPHVEREALTQLQYAMAVLRMTPDSALHRQLARADTILRKIRNSNTPIHQYVTNPKRQPSSPLAERIAKPCLECHYLSGGKILWANGEQEVLRRANFDHRAHFVQRDCLGCHFKIDVARTGADSLLSVRRDRASVQNLPEIETCRQCHAEEKASQDCVKCHEFHP